MNRDQNDLRCALHDLEQRADEHGAPSLGSIMAAARDPRPTAHRHRRWLPPVATAVSVAAVAAIVTVAVDSGSDRPAGRGGAGHAGSPTAAPKHSSAAMPRPRVTKVAPLRHPSAHVAVPVTTGPAAILEAAAAQLDQVAWTAPAPARYFYVHTTEATTWTSVSGTRAGKGTTSDGTTIWVSGCSDGKIVSAGESGDCTLNDVPHFLPDAPTGAGAWDAYLEHLAPGAKAADAQGKIIVEVLHQDLVAPKAAAALLRYTATSCPGLRSVSVRPVAGKHYDGVTCTSMTNGSYGLVFDPVTHAFRGYVVLGQDGRQSAPAEIVLRTGVVSALGSTP